MRCDPQGLFPICKYKYPGEGLAGSPPGAAVPMFECKKVNDNMQGWLVYNQAAGCTCPTGEPALRSSRSQPRRMRRRTSHGWA